MANAQAATWRIQPAAEEEAARLAGQCGLQLPAMRVLWNRGYRDVQAVEKFLNPRLTDLHDPLTLTGMQAAVERIRRAVRERERILLYGDYDVDGTASVVILKKTLELLGHQAGFFIPDRLKDGYGIHSPVIEQAAASGVKLIISVDTGIRAREAAETARRHGIDLIITDHHLPEAELPPAYAIINPNQPSCDYPNKNLCGAGVTFKLVQALMYQEEWPPEKIVRFSDSFLILVAIATVADVVPLTGENRVIVKRGLAGLGRTRNPGLRALLKTAGFESGACPTATDVGFRISPRINAAGRMRNARDVIDLFLTADESRAAQIAAELHLLNEERRQTEETIIEAARNLENAGTTGLVFSAEGWHRGVLGIVASRLVEHFNRPALVLSEDPASGQAQGSGRSIPGFHLLEALESMSDLLTRFGGHKYAVGLSVALDRLDEFRRRFDAYAQQVLTGADLCRTHTADAPVRVEEINDASVEEILRIAPFGLGNPTPTFILRNVELKEAPVVMKERHLRMRLHSGGGWVHAKAWRFAERLTELPCGARLDVLVRFKEDNYSRSRGYAPWTTDIVDVRPAENPE